MQNYYSIIRSIFDLVIAAAILLLSSPILLLISLSILLETGWPFLFSQERLGKHGTPFSIWKFRTMRHDAEDRLNADPQLYEQYIENDYKLLPEVDPRLTRIGKHLRRTSLDELPQFWNVLKGHMSIVGPRPIVHDEIQHYKGHEEILLSVKPGITGLWQVSGRSDIGYPERAEIELDYINRSCLWLDIKIMIKTAWVVLSSHGAH